MKNRRQFIKDAASMGVVFTGCGLAGNRLTAQSGAAPKRRQVTVGGRRVKVIDVHSHVIIPEATALMGVKTAPENASVLAPTRFERMDEQGIDMEAMSINANW